jgi:glycosyltransferase involved in cell wall biosynthesis
MNIWMVHPFAGGPAGLGRHWRPFWLADAWIRMGHRPLVVSARFHHLHRELQIAGPRRIENVDYWFLETPRYGDGNLGRLWNNLSFGPRFRRDATRMAERFGKPDLIIASTPHLFFVSAAQRIARRFNAKFWVEVRDLWPESIVALGLAPSGHPLMKVIGWKEQQAYRGADRVICLLAGAEAHMTSRGLPAGRFVWVPNGVSEEEIRSALVPPNMTHPLIERVGRMKEQGKRVVLYAGAMGPPNAMEVVVDAAAALAATSPGIHFVLIGSGISRTQLERRAADLPNVEFHNEVERPIVHDILRASDCAVVSFHKNALYHHGISPNKLFDYCLFARRTVIACEQKALTGYEDLATLRCAPDSPAAMAEALIAALQGPERDEAERTSIVRRFSYSRLAEHYLD